MESNFGLDESSAPSPNNSSRFACPYCPKTFKSGQALGGHHHAHRLNGNRARSGHADAPNAGNWFNHGPITGVQLGSGGEHGQGSMTSGLGDGHHHRIEFLSTENHIEPPAGSYVNDHSYVAESSKQESPPSLTIDFFKEWVLLENFGGDEPSKISSERSLSDHLNVGAPLNGTQDGVELSSKEKVVDLDLRLWF